MTSKPISPDQGQPEDSFAAFMGAALPGLLARGFPAADATTGNYDLDAIDLWRRQRHSGEQNRNPGSPVAPRDEQPAKHGPEKKLADDQYRHGDSGHHRPVTPP